MTVRAGCACGGVRAVPAAECELCLRRSASCACGGVRAVPAAECKMCGVVPLTCQGRPAARLPLDPSRPYGAFTGSRPDLRHQASRRLTTRQGLGDMPLHPGNPEPCSTDWPLHHQLREPLSSPTPHGQPYADWMRSQLAYPLESGVKSQRCRSEVRRLIRSEFGSSALEAHTRSGSRRSKVW
jgi:hypothetical protein